MPSLLICKKLSIVVRTEQKDEAESKKTAKPKNQNLALCLGKVIGCLRWPVKVFLHIYTIESMVEADMQDTKPQL